MTLGEKAARNLKALRTKKKLTQEQVAAKAKVSVSYISMLERGSRSPPLDTLESLASALGVGPVDLLR